MKKKKYTIQTQVILIQREREREKCRNVWSTWELTTWINDSRLFTYTTCNSAKDCFYTICAQIYNIIAYDSNQHIHIDLHRHTYIYI